MSDNPLAFTVSVLGVVLGLALLLYAEAMGMSRTYVVAGGAVVIVAVGVLTVAIARLDEPEGEAGGH